MDFFTFNKIISRSSKLKRQKRINEKRKICSTSSSNEKDCTINLIIDSLKEKKEAEDVEMLSNDEMTYLKSSTETKVEDAEALQPYESIIYNPKKNSKQKCSFEQILKKGFEAFKKNLQALPSSEDETSSDDDEFAVDEYFLKHFNDNIKVSLNINLSNQQICVNVQQKRDNNWNRIQKEREDEQMEEESRFSFKIPHKKTNIKNESNALALFSSDKLNNPQNSLALLSHLFKRMNIEKVNVIHEMLE